MSKCGNYFVIHTVQYIIPANYPGLQPVFRIWVLLSSSGEFFFLSLDLDPDSIRKIRIRIHEKTANNCDHKGEKNLIS